MKRLGANIVEAKCLVYAWVLMTNYVHILFESGGKGISTVMRKLLTKRSAIMLVSSYQNKESSDK